jgi:hypothetical protein
MMKHKLITALIPGLFVLSSLAMAQQTFVVKPLVEKKVTELPSGDLFWRIDNLETKEQAQEAAGPMGLVAEAKGKVWLFTLGPAGEAAKDGKRVAEIGPIPGSVQRSTSCGSTKQAVLRAVSRPYTPTPVRRRFTSSAGS